MSRRKYTQEQAKIIFAQHGFVLKEQYHNIQLLK
jgi:hypothetical protein